jgi:hypothetical protein
MVPISPALEISDHYAKHARTSGRSYNCDYMVDVRDQVTITFFSPPTLRSLIILSKCQPLKGLLYYMCTFLILSVGN